MKIPFILILLIGIFVLSSSSKSEAQDVSELEAELDHVMLAVKDLTTAKELFVDTLGFREGPGGRLPGGRENFILGFSNKTYLEPITVHNIDETSRLGAFLSKHEGSPAMALRVPSAEWTAQYLKNRDLAIAGPTAGGPVVEGNEASEPMFHYVIFTQPVLPNGLFFIEYNEEARSKVVEQLPSERQNFTEHPNTASHLRAVWVAVHDVNKAAESYQSIGFKVDDVIQISNLNAKARQIWLNGNGYILLLEAEDTSSAVASFLKDRDEGIMGVTLEVGSLDKVLEMLKDKMQQDFVSYEGLLGKSILIPADRAHGLYIEMVDRQ
jgi:catechol 2,3-dioxygenase-like lactoylglutathione lyase family enzyme